MTIARVPSTYSPSTPTVASLIPVRSQDNLYTLSDAWYIRDDIPVGRFTIDHVLVSAFGVFALFEHHRQGVLQVTSGGFTVQGERQDALIQHAWHAAQALEHHLGTSVQPWLVYRSLSARSEPAAPVVSRRGYTAEAAEAPAQTHWRIQGTTVTSWEHVVDVLEGHHHKVLRWQDVMLQLAQLRQLS